MGRDATKAASNPWYQARIKASEYDERLRSREGAAELLGMSVSSVADAELSLSKCMPVDKAVLMADLYKAPHLINHYCLNECPIGCRHCISDEVIDIERATLKLLKILDVDRLHEIKKKLSSLMFTSLSETRQEICSTGFSITKMFSRPRTWCSTSSMLRCIRKAQCTSHSPMKNSCTA